MSREEVNVVHPSWSPDGLEIAYSRLSPVTSQWEIWILNLQTQQHRHLTDGLFPEFQPGPTAALIAAALFGMQHGVPSIALSQSRGFQNPHSCPWETPTAWGAKVLRPIIEKGWPDDLVMNVNFPDRAPDEVEGVRFTRQGLRDERIIRTEGREDLRGNAYYWIGYRGKLSNPDEGTDLRAIYDGYISVSPLHVDLTHEAFLAEMRDTWQT